MGTIVQHATRETLYKPQSDAVKSHGMDDFNTRISDALVAYMADRGIQKKSVAAELGRSANYVTQRTTGVYDLSVDIIGAVASLSRISPRALMVELSERIATGQGDSSVGIPGE